VSAARAQHRFLYGRECMLACESLADTPGCRFNYAPESKAAIEARLGIEISDDDVNAHKRMRPDCVRAWGSRSVSCNSDESNVLQIEEERGGAFAAAVTKGCVFEVKGHPITARFKIISLRSIVCIGFLRSTHNAAQPSVSRDVLELRPSEIVGLCACRSNGECDDVFW
jgi:hypothetical protein